VNAMAIPERGVVKHQLHIAAFKNALRQLVTYPQFAKATQLR